MMDYVLRFLLVFGILCIIDILTEFKRINGWFDANDKTLDNLYEYVKNNDPDIDSDIFEKILDCIPITEYEYSGVSKILYIIMKKWRKRNDK